MTIAILTGTVLAILAPSGQNHTKESGKLPDFPGEWRTAKGIECEILSTSGSENSRSRPNLFSPLAGGQHGFVNHDTNWLVRVVPD